MKYRNVSDFSAKDSREYNRSMRLFEQASLEASNELETFQDALYNHSEIPTRLRQKSRNASNFLDEDYISKRKMNANTNAVRELTEKLMFGSTEEDLDLEITDGGVAKEIANVLVKHGITGKAAKQTLEKLVDFYGVNPDMEQFTKTEEEELETEDLNEALQRTARTFKQRKAIKNLKNKYSRSNSLKEALLVSPTGEFRSEIPSKRTVVAPLNNVLFEGEEDYDDEEDCFMDPVDAREWLRDGILEWFDGYGYDDVVDYYLDNRVCLDRVCTDDDIDEYCVDFEDWAESLSEEQWFEITGCEKPEDM